MTFSLSNHAIVLPFMDLYFPLMICKMTCAKLGLVIFVRLFQFQRVAIRHRILRSRYLWNSSYVSLLVAPTCSLKLCLAFDVNQIRIILGKI